jgi:hypothetical protein
MTIQAGNSTGTTLEVSTMTGRARFISTGKNFFAVKIVCGIVIPFWWM